MGLSREAIRARLGRRIMGAGSAAWWTASGAYALVIFALSSQPDPLGVQRLPPFTDKLIHALVFGGLSLLVHMAWRRSFPGRPWFWSVIAITALYGLSDEFHQSFVPGRSMDAWDLVADTVGACAVQWGLATRRFASLREAAQRTV
ncbi:MAG: VanZ family protein [Nitrospirota bacterium]